MGTASHIYSHVNITLTVPNKQGHKMLKLLTLLIAGAAAAPQYAPYGYPLAYQPAYQYGYYPQYRYLPVHYPIYPGAVTPDVTAQTRGLFGLEIAGFKSHLITASPLPATNTTFMFLLLLLAVPMP